MALKSCKECGAQVSGKADYCPQCGAPVMANQKVGPIAGIIFVGVGIFVFGLILVRYLG